jgi:hypothetical protein
MKPSIHADDLDEQVADLIKSLKLTPTWEEDVRQLLHEEQDGPDPETERKEIRTMLRLMRDNSVSSRSFTSVFQQIESRGSLYAQRRGWVSSQ